MENSETLEKMIAKLNLVLDRDRIKVGLDLGALDAGSPDGEHVILVLQVLNVDTRSTAYAFHFERWDGKSLVPCDDRERYHFADAFRSNVNAGNYAKELMMAWKCVEKNV